MEDTVGTTRAVLEMYQRCLILMQKAWREKWGTDKFQLWRQRDDTYLCLSENFYAPSNQPNLAKPVPKLCLLHGDSFVRHGQLWKTLLSVRNCHIVSTVTFLLA